MTMERGIGSVAAVLAVAAVCWVLAVRQMAGMDMGAATELGSLGSFLAVWVPMMAAMMLPGALPAIARRARPAGFAASYLAVWALVGLAAYALYRPHGHPAAGAVVLAAGLYELTPLKRACRRRCREPAGSGLRFGLDCAGSSLG
jgi:predicted metal-binding membrane protein